MSPAGCLRRTACSAAHQPGVQRPSPDGSGRTPRPAAAVPAQVFGAGVSRDPWLPKECQEAGFTDARGRWWIHTPWRRWQLRAGQPFLTLRISWRRRWKEQLGCFYMNDRILYKEDFIVHLYNAAEGLINPGS